MTLFFISTLFALLIALVATLLPLWRQTAGKEYVSLGTALLFIIPAALISLYVLIGEPRGVDRTMEPSDQLRAQLITIANELERNPSNQDGWFALGMAYKNIESFSAAEHAFRRALYLDENNVLIMIELAETLLFAGPGEVSEEAGQLLRLAYQIEPDNQKALWLLGVFSFSTQNFELAIEQWQTLLATLPEEAPVRTSIERQISLARQQLGEEPSGRMVEVSLDIDSSLRQKLTGNEPIFLIAQAVTGPTTPLAAKRLTVDQLPITVPLSDADAMIEGMTLSSFSELLITARVSLGGDVTPQPGDLEGRVSVGPSTRVNLRINTEIAQPDP